MKSKNVLALTIILSSSFSPLTVFADNNVESVNSEVSKTESIEVNRNDLEDIETEPKKNEVNQYEGSESVDSWMPDNQLQMAVAGALDITVDELTKEKVAELGTVSGNKSVQTSGVNSLEGLQYAKNGTNMVFVFRNGNISDLTPLTGLGIAQLDVENNNISDLSALKNIALNTLIIKNNNVNRLSGWGLSSSIQIINADSNHISDISSIGSSTTMFLARYQTITNPPIERSEHITIPSVRHVSNYHFVENNFSISDNGVYAPLYNNSGTIEWNNLSSETDHLEYSFDRQYSNSSSEDYLKANKVYFSGTVIQPFTGSEVSKGSVVVKYVDEDGEEIAEEKTLTGNVGESYDVTTSDYKLGISGYTLDENRLPDNANGTFTDQSQVVTYVYEKNQDKTSLIVHDSELTVGDTWTAEDNFDSATDYYGNSVSFSDITVEGEVDTTEVGTYKVTYRRFVPNFFSNSENQGTYSAVATIKVSEPQPEPLQGADVTVQYVDEEGNKLQDDIILKGNVGETYTSEQKEFDGYTFKEVKEDNATGTFSDKGQTVTYVYTKNEEVTLAHVVVHDSTLSVNDSWSPEDNFDEATDASGNEIDFSEITVDGEVDTTTPGQYTVTYTRLVPNRLSDNQHEGTYTASATVTVLASDTTEEENKGSENENNSESNNTTDNGNNNTPNVNVTNNNDNSSSNSDSNAPVQTVEDKSQKSQSDQSTETVKAEKALPETGNNESIFAVVIGLIVLIGATSTAFYSKLKMHRNKLK